DVFRTYAGYVLNEKGTGGIEVIYNIDCQDKGELCKKNKQSDKERAMKWMESVQFINENEGEDRECRSHPLRRRMTQLEYDVLKLYLMGVIAISRRTMSLNEIIQSPRLIVSTNFLLPVIL